ncbi:MAG: hypothetical protein IJT73_01695 [Selenomonadaceae bacterium]|nr:hypothetical protein [Selenomonadaceae bacterium]
MTFKLANDIDLGKVAEEQSNHTAIRYFSGTFDGEGHTIDNLTISSDADNQRLFGYVGYGGKVKNVRLTNAKISGVSNVGSVVYYSNGIIKNCAHSGAVSSNVSYVTDAGVIVGYKIGAISNCY